MKFKKINYYTKYMLIADYELEKDEEKMWKENWEHL